MVRVTIEISGSTLNASVTQQDMENNDADERVGEVLGYALLGVKNNISGSIRGVIARCIACHRRAN